METKLLNRILVVEDNENDLELMLDAMAETNISNRVDTVLDGEDALNYIYCRGKFSERRSGNPIVVLLDIRLPKVNGLEVLKEIKQNDKYKMIPVVMLTSSKEESDKIESYSYGANAYIVKPLDFQKFAETIKHLGMFWTLINEPVN